MSSSQEQVKPDYRLLRALAALNRLGCHVTLRNDRSRTNCFTVELEMVNDAPSRRPVVQPFSSIDLDGSTCYSHCTHIHTGFSDCTEEQGYRELCEALERAAETIKKCLLA